MTDDRHDPRLDGGDDVLRGRLRRIDPVPESTPMESPTSPSARTRLEHIMNSDLNADPNTDITTDTPTSDAAPEPPTRAPGTPTPRRTPGTPHAASHDGRPRWRRPTWMLATAAAAVLIAAVGVVAVNLGDGGTEPMASPLVFDLGASDALASCLPFEVDVLATMSPAFAATATAVEGDVVTLDVDRWYAGGDAETVQLRATPGQAALIAGFDVVVGEQYLITASEGTVNFCGYSGPATAEFTAQFEQAFGG